MALRGRARRDFELPDENGVPRRLSELQGGNAMVLHISRGEHCPRERQHHRELLRLHEWCSVAFTELVSILPNDLHDTYKLKISTGARWTFLADSELEVQRHFDINEYTDPPPRQRRRPAHPAPLPRPGDRKGLRRLLMWSRPPRPSNAQLWADLGDLHRRIKPDFDPTTPQARAAWEAARAAPARA